jgi:biotin carboxylase
MRQALADAEVDGIATNLPLLRRLVQHARFVEGRYDTGAIAEVTALPV